MLEMARISQPNGVGVEEVVADKGAPGPQGRARGVPDRAGSSGSPSPSSRPATRRWPRSTGADGARCAARASSPAPCRCRARPRPGPVAQVLLRTVVLPLPPTEHHDVDAVAFGVGLDGIDEPLRDRRHQRRRRHCGAPDRAEEIRRARRLVQQRHVDVQVQPVDAFEGQRRAAARGPSCPGVCPGIRPHRTWPDIGSPALRRALQCRARR